ncbi:hypothetical protein SAMN04488003_12043 [Loktanella fryxellensis]|uniref:Uncharacterized protein n=1 Tax=Loktanella fryxellensis TaxID=245187 RepID=A0A1H8HEI1_9RHOB|nr:hypothetical protein SAMN04488003_12043 [Loktanella fryxellensis]
MTKARPILRNPWLVGCTALTLLPAATMAQEAAPDLSTVCRRSS